jgi:hypothetical protein
MGEVEDAEPIYREGLAISPTDIRLKKALADVMPFVLKERAYRAMGLRNFAEAASLYAEGALLKSSMRPYFLVAQSKALSMGGHAPPALEIAQKAVREHPRSRYTDTYIHSFAYAVKRVDSCF